MQQRKQSPPTRKALSRELRRKLPKIQPLTIVSQDEELAAIWYQPVSLNSLQRNQSVVICNAMGHEATRSFRNLQQLAIRLSQDGFDVVRFDFACTGNSTGRDHQATLHQWRSDIHAVVNHIRHDKSLTQPNHKISVLGIRLGANSPSSNSIDGNRNRYLVGPYFSGHNYLNSLRSQHSYQLTSLTRFLKLRKAEPDQFMGIACSQIMQREIASIQLSDSIQLEPTSRWFVTSKDHLSVNRHGHELSGWQHVSSQDEIYWDEKEYANAAFSSPNSSRVIASIFADGVSNANATLLWRVWTIYSGSTANLS